MLPRIQIILTALLFSTGGAVIKAIDLTSWQVASFRSLVAAVTLMVLMPHWRRFWEPRTLLVGSAFAATMILYVTGNKLTTAANTIFLQATAPVYLLFLGPLVLKEKTRLADAGLAAVLFAGLALFFVGHEDPQATAPDPLLGNVVAVASGIGWALTLLGLRWLGRDAAVGTTSAGRAVVAGSWIAFAVTLPMALPLGPSSAEDWGLVVFLGVFQIGLAYVLMTRAVRHIRAVEAALLLLIEPVAATALAWWIHGERPAPWALAGCALILIGTVARTAVPSERVEPSVAGS